MIIDCNVIRESILFEVKEEVDKLGFAPTLAIITCSHDEPSQIYVRNKIKTAEQVGIKAVHYNLEPSNFENTEQLAEFVTNMNEKANAIIVQLPLDPKFDEKVVTECVMTNRDVDGLTKLNVAKLVDGDKDAIVPATAQAAYEIISTVYGGDLSHMDVTVVNRSKLIGKPLQSLLTNHNATVTMCHSKTNSVMIKTFNADIVVVGIGKPNYFDKHYFSMTKTQLVIDCGISRVDGKLYRDVDPEVDRKNILLANKVGVITTACLMQNVVKCTKLQNK